MTVDKNNDGISLTSGSHPGCDLNEAALETMEIEILPSRTHEADESYSWARGYTPWHYLKPETGEEMAKKKLEADEATFRLECLKIAAHNEQHKWHIEAILERAEKLYNFVKEKK